MRVQTQERGPARHEAPPEKISRDQATDHRQDTATADVVKSNVPTAAMRPFKVHGHGGHGWWLAIVDVCPHDGCGQVHVHRAGPAGGRRRAACGREYTLVAATGKGWSW